MAAREAANYNTPTLSWDKKKKTRKTQLFYMQLSWDLLYSIACVKELAILKIWSHRSVGKY